MTEERHVDLIHAELDGELTSGQRAELDQLLLVDPEVRALREELNLLVGTLAKVASVEPPPGVAKSVLQAIDLQSTQEPGATKRAGLLRAAWSTRPLLRYAAVFAAGLLASAVVLQFGSGGRSGPDVSQLVGTIGGHDLAARAAPIDRIEFDLDQVSGSASAYELQSALVLELDLSSRQAVRVVVVQGDRSISFNLAARPGVAPERILWVAGDARTRGPPIELKVFGSETLLYEGALETSRAGRSE